MPPKPTPTGFGFWTAPTPSTWPRWTDCRPALAVGQPFGGLHAVEQDLWLTTPGSGQPADLAAGLVELQAQVAQFLLAKEVLDPEAIGAARRRV